MSEAAAPRQAVHCRTAFDDMSGEPEQEYVSGGTTEDIDTELKRLRARLVPQ